MNIGIMAVDPGGKSGIAWAVLDLGRMTGEALRKRAKEHSGSDTISGPEQEQIVQIGAIWSEFRQKCVKELRLPLQNVELVIEDFVLRPGPHAGGKEGTSPVRIGWGIVGFRLGRAFEFELHGMYGDPNAAPTPTIFQNPTDAAAFANNERLRSWDCWIRGREHERSAWKHVATRHAVRRKQRGRSESA